MKMKCPYCKHKWEYKGNKEIATCPKCHYKVNVSKNRVKIRKVSKTKRINNIKDNINNINKRIIKIEEKIESIEKLIRELDKPITFKQTQESTEGVLIKCEKCQYTWKYKGKMKTTRCINCNARVNTEKNRITKQLTSNGSQEI